MKTQTLIKIQELGTASVITLGFAYGQATERGVKPCFLRPTDTKPTYPAPWK